MKPHFVRDLQPNQVVTTTFLVHIKDVRQKKTGEPYLSLLLGDRTGEVDAKMWDNVAEVLEAFERDDFVKVKGLLQVYQNRHQLTIHKIRKAEEEEVEFGDYFPCSERSPDEMFTELRGIVAEVSNPHLRALLDLFLNDEEFARLYRTAPAAKSVHHAYLGGLIEHVLSLCALCKMTAAHYRQVDLDLLLTGAILHDIGKVRELSYARSFGYSNDGQLLGHIVIGLGMLQEKARQLPDLPVRVRTLLEHMIISHHGELEFGSPKVPLFAEALLLHHLDNLDSKMDCMRAMVNKDRLIEGCWTVYNTTMERPVLKKHKYLDDAVADGTPEPASKSNDLAEEEKPADHVNVVSEVTREEAPLSAFSPPAATENSSRHDKSLSLFAEKLQQAWHQD